MIMSESAAAETEAALSAISGKSAKMHQLNASLQRIQQGIDQLMSTLWRTVPAQGDTVAVCGCGNNVLLPWVGARCVFQDSVVSDICYQYGLYHLFLFRAATAGLYEESASELAITCHTFAQLRRAGTRAEALPLLTGMLQQCLQALSHATLSSHSTHVFRACVLSLATRAMQISRRFSSPEEDGTLRAVISTLLLDVGGCNWGRRLLQLQLRSQGELEQLLASLQRQPESQSLAMLSQIPWTELLQHVGAQPLSPEGLESLLKHLGQQYLHACQSNQYALLLLLANALLCFAWHVRPATSLYPIFAILCHSPLGSFLSAPLLLHLPWRRLEDHAPPMQRSNTRFQCYARLYGLPPQTTLQGLLASSQGQRQQFLHQVVTCMLERAPLLQSLVATLPVPLPRPLPGLFSMLRVLALIGHLDIEELGSDSQLGRLVLHDLFRFALVPWLPRGTVTLVKWYDMFKQVSSRAAAPKRYVTPSVFSCVLPPYPHVPHPPCRCRKRRLSCVGTCSLTASSYKRPSSTPWPMTCASSIFRKRFLSFSLPSSKAGYQMPPAAACSPPC
jgi:hypothetical protein